MKTSKLLVASVLMLGAVGSSFAAGKTLKAMNEKEMQATSMVAVCAVANQRFSDLMTKNPELRSAAAGMASSLRELLGVFLSDPAEVRGMLDYANSQIKDNDGVTKTMASCLEFQKAFKS
jgi:hypothetical protein